ncbi:MAG: hypothetical protein SFW36_19510, partial [Leptolyngbyaceae cyanobacterium bins.59]|nr:hypothetical protein [Leptolyngbyaceae cyanobacterium bins.59]
GQTYIVYGKGDGNPIYQNGLDVGTGGYPIPTPNGFNLNDVNKDGLRDWGTNDPYADPLGRTDAGTITVNLNGAGSFQVYGSTPGAGINSPDWVGDLNNDGYADFTIQTNAAATDGRTYVVFGKADLNNIDLAQVEQGIGGFAIAGSASESTGLSLGMKDVTGDGYFDIATGGPLADPLGRTDAGIVYVSFGGPMT